MERTITDALAVAPAVTMPWWISALHGFAGELAFWCAVFVAVGRALWLVWDYWDRFQHRRNTAKPFTGERFGAGKSPEA